MGISFNFSFISIKQLEKEEKVEYDAEYFLHFHKMRQKLCLI